jgi:multiple sugar transport system substrate-binding protein
MALSVALMANEPPSISLKYWVLFSGGDARPMQLMVDKFNASHKKINVEMKIIRWAEYYPTLNKNIHTKNAPDIAIIHASLLPWYVQRNALCDLTPYNIQWQDISPKLLQAIRFNQKYFALPLDMHPQVLYFNKKYLAQANLLDKNNQPIIGSGIDGFVTFMQKLQQSLPPDVLPISTPNNNVLNWWIWYSLYSQQENKGYIINNKAAFNNPSGKKAFEFFYKMREAKVWSQEIHDEKGYNLFKFNKAATMITGVWTTWNFQQNKDLDFGVVEFPKIFDKRANFGDSHTLIVLKSNDMDKQKASAEFIRWISENSYDWAISGQVPANTKVLATKQFKNLPFRNVYVQSANTMTLYPKHLKLKECNDAMIKILADFMKSHDSVDETIIKAEKTLNAILKSSK